MSAPVLQDVDAARLAEWPELIASIFAGERLGAIVRGAFAREPMGALQHALASGRAGVAPAEMQHYPGQQYGRALVVSSDRDEYFAQGDRVRVAVERHAPGFEAQLSSILGTLAGGATVEPARDATGRSYGAFTVRVLRPGGGIDVHCERETLRFPPMQELAKQLDPSTQLSFYVPLATPEGGGELNVFHLRHGEGPGRALESMDRRSTETLTYVESQGVTRPRPQVGDLLVFDAGRHFHRVSPVEGGRHRWTMGGFLARSRDGSRIHYWC